MRSLIIKGDPFEAMHAASARGIQLDSAREVRGSIGPRLTVGYTSASVDALNQWVCEAPHSAPFPIGALLYWSEAPLS